MLINNRLHIGLLKVIVFSDEISSKADLVKQQLSQKPSFGSYTSSLKAFTRKELTDVPSIFEKGTVPRRQ